MPRPPTVIEIRLSNVVKCVDLVLPIINDLVDACGSPFLPTISNTTSFLITLVQKVKRNREECIHLMEDIHGLLCAILCLHMKSESLECPGAEALEYLSQFTEHVSVVFHASC
ncbi:hypothetical protein K438DRAFT_1137146 [Mycena galopus ATCC 62051]|nr:hypothetical protein K438DRAFT_1137146 [Mycena galopus ATCC 62051]